MVHDIVPDDNHDMPAFERYALARQYVETLRHDRVKLATLYAFGGHNLIQQVAEKVWARKNKNISKEGAIGKIAKAPYEMGKKNKSIIKVKCEVTLDMVVVGWEAGEVGSKYETTLGKLIVEQASGKRHSVSGMSDDDRDAWYNDFGLINRQVVELDAMQVLPNGSLREGRYKCIRHDKDVSEID